MQPLYDLAENNIEKYEEFISHVDPGGNLKTALFEIADWKNATVVEAGIRTGRITAMYIKTAAFVYGFDRSPLMVCAASENLESFHQKSDLKTGRHKRLPTPPELADIFIQSWTFGYEVCEKSENVEETLEELFNNALPLVKEGGTIIIIEPMGVYNDKPAPPAPPLERMYSLLEEKYGFAKKTIRTDYAFASAVEGEKLCRLFFGDEIADQIAKRQSIHVPHWTGIWYKVKE